MSNLETDPVVQQCPASSAPGPRTEFYPARTVPLGGLRAMQVERVLPQRALSTVGAWCFLDHFGSERTAHEYVSNIGPHPHIGLQTVTWPFVGRIRHRDSIGSDVEIRSGQLNLMTAGRGIAHGEDAVAGALAGHGIQFWIALPDAHRQQEPHFEQHRDLPVVRLPGLTATVLIGTLAGATSPASAYTPIVGADLRLDPGASLDLPLEPGFEHALLVIDGDLTAADAPAVPGPLLYLGSDRAGLRLTSKTGAHAVLVGGEPFDEDLVMWWNLVARSHDEIVAARDAWEGHDTTRFGDIAGYSIEERWAAPPLPNVRLKPRPRRAEPDRP